MRERREDIPLLFIFFLERFSRQHRTRPRQVDPEVLPYLERYAWPGNVRELRNLCERLVIFGADPLTPDQLPFPRRAADLPPPEVKSLGLRRPGAGEGEEETD